MKTSNKILIVAGLVVMGWVLIYDMAVKAEFVKEDYKKPHYQMKQLVFTNFNTIQHNAGNIIGIEVEKGPYGVWVDEFMDDKIAITQHGQTLQIDYTGTDYHGSGRGIVINCPDLVSITTNAFIKAGKSNNYEYQNNYVNSIIINGQYTPTSVEGFTAPLMNVCANEFTSIILENNTLGQLNAKIGDSKGRAGLTVRPDNKITSADLQVPGKSALVLDNVAIGKIAYKLADSADVRLTGKAAHLLDQ